MAQKLKSTKVKIALLGSNGVGKTAFAVRFLTKRFIGDYDSNKEITYNHKLIYDKDELQLELVDTAGSPVGFDHVAEEHIQWADGVVLMLSVDNKGSLQKVYQYADTVHELHRRRPGKLPSSGDEMKTISNTQAIVVVNKTDMMHACQVTDSELQKLRRRIGFPVFEISVAESPDGVTSSVHELIRLIRKEQNHVQSPVEKKSGAFLNVKKVLRKKIARSKSDSTAHFHS